MQIAFNYGSRAEIVSAIQKIVDSGEQNITEELISKNLCTANIPDPDLLVRTGGEMRVSNYLLWQIAYSELFFTDTLWPDFTKDELVAIVENFKTRERRYGKV